MILPRLALRNPQFSLMAISVLVILGALSIINMPRSEDPQFDFPFAVVRVIYPGTNPLDMEKLILDPLEKAINELDDIKVLKGDVEDGLAIIRVEFLYGSDPSEKYNDVVSEVNRVRDTLPQGIHTIAVDRLTPGDVNIMQLALMSQTDSYHDLRLQAEDLQKEINRVAGVKHVAIEACPQQQVHVSAHLLKMRAMGVGLEQLIRAVKASSVNLPGGHVLADQRRFTVRTSGDFSNLDQIRRTPVSSRDDQIIYVEDIASVSQEDALPSYQARYNGTRAVFVSASQRKGSNIIEVLEALHERVDQFRQNLPGTMQLQWVHDQGISVDKRLGNFVSSLLMGLLVVALITIVTLGLKVSCLIVLVIPASVIIALGWVDMMGFGLQQMSIVGLVIALGLLVDNAIVVTENIGRLKRSGYDRQRAAREGASQVGWAVVSGTVTTMLAFFPMLILKTGAGEFIRSMPVTVILTLLASLIIALTVIPLLASRYLVDSEEPSALLKKVDRLAHGRYSQVLAVVLANPAKTLLVAISLFASSLFLVPLVGVSMFPKADKAMFLINVDAVESASFEQTDAWARQIEEILDDYPQISSVATNIGKGNPYIFYSAIPGRQVPSFAQLVVQLNTDSVAVRERLVDELREKTRHLPGMEITIKELLQGPPYEAPVAIRVISDNFDSLTAMATAIVSQMEEIEGLISAHNPAARRKIDLHVNINREKAAILGVPIDRIDQAVRSSLVGIEAGRFHSRDGLEYPILIKSSGQREPQISDLDSVIVQSVSGALIPLLSLATLEMKESQARIQHRGTSRVTLVSADVAQGYEAEALTNTLVERLNTLDWPADVKWQVGGEQEKRQEAFRGMGGVALLALMGIFTVLVLQFRSFGQPAIVFSAIPFAMTGSILALLLTGYTFSFTALVGLTSLVGIVVNNSIILVDSANQLRLDGRSLTEAIMESSRMRLLPILLTTLTTIGGLLPLTLGGSSMWAPMGLCIIGGLIVSTLLTLFVVPVLYLLLTPQAVPSHNG